MPSADTGCLWRKDLFERSQVRKCHTPSHHHHCNYYWNSWWTRTRKREGRKAMLGHKEDLIQRWVRTVTQLFLFETCLYSCYSFFFQSSLEMTTNDFSSSYLTRDIREVLKTSRDCTRPSTFLFWCICSAQEDHFWEDLGEEKSFWCLWCSVFFLNKECDSTFRSVMSCQGKEHFILYGMQWMNEWSNEMKLVLLSAFQCNVKVMLLKNAT